MKTSIFKELFILALIGWSVFLGAGTSENILENYNFAAKKSNGAPAKWILRPDAKSFEFKKGTAILHKKVGDKRLVILQYNNLPIKVGELVQFECQAVATVNTKFYIYYEAFVKGKLVISRFPVERGQGTMKKIVRKFSKPAGAQSDRLMILLDNPGTLAVSELSLKK